MNDTIPHLSNRKVKFLVSAKIYYIVAVILTLIGLGAGGYFYYQYQQNLPKNVMQRNQEEAKRLAAEVGKFMLLPNDELPTIATVTDVSKLNNQIFFKFAKNGDKVLIFTKSQMAILYSPSAHKIINVGPVNVGAQPNQAPQAKIAILNGTVTDGLAGKEQTSLQSTFPGASIVKTGTANNTDYAKTIVVVFNPLAKSAGQALATFYNATVTNLPSTESPQDGVDILIILGKDRLNSALAPSLSPVPTKPASVLNSTDTKK